MLGTSEGEINLLLRVAKQRSPPPFNFISGNFFLFSAIHNLVF